MTLAKIVSGGQTGVDRGALDAALAVNFPCGGWMPGDRMAEDGIIPERYPMKVLPGGSYRQRTLRNVINSDGTAILFYETLSGGTLLTRDLCVREKKSFIVMDAKQVEAAEAAAVIVKFVEEMGISVLNVAGPQASGWAEGYGFSLRVIGEVIARVIARRAEPWPAPGALEN
jgi:hypothetical protein